MNGIEHGGKNDPRKRVRASMLRTEQFDHRAYSRSGQRVSRWTFCRTRRFRTRTDSPIRHVEVRAEEGRRPGGFGILMTRNLVDELLYNERGNAVLFVKYL